MSDYSNAVRINYNEDFNNVEVSGNVTPDSEIDIEKYVGYLNKQETRDICTIWVQRNLRPGYYVWV